MFGAALPCRCIEVCEQSVASLATSPPRLHPGHCCIPAYLPTFDVAATFTSECLAFNLWCCRCWPASRSSLPAAASAWPQTPAAPRCSWPRPRWIGCWTAFCAGRRQSGEDDRALRAARALLTASQAEVVEGAADLGQTQGQGRFDAPRIASVEAFGGARPHGALLQQAL